MRDMASKLMVVAVASVLSSGAASAADMALKAPMYAKAPMTAAFNWSGFYIGGYVGGAGADRDAVATEPLSTNGGPYYNVPGSNTSYGLGASFIGGGTIGYNWQMPASNIVFGLEGEAGYLHLQGSRQDINATNLGIALPDSIDTSRLGDWYGVIAGRLGWAADRALLYAKGGVAFVGNSYSFNDTCIGAGAPACGGGELVTGHTSTDVTYAVGAGLEYALTNNWSVKAEYLYLGTQKTYAQTGVVSGVGAGNVDTNLNTDPGIHTGKIGINYRFGGPVVARY